MKRTTLFLALVMGSSVLYAEEPKVISIAPKAYSRAAVEEGAVPKITSVPMTGRMVALDEVQVLNGTEFALFYLSDYEGEVLWDLSSPDSVAVLPVKFFECDPKKETRIIGIRAGQIEPAEHLVPPSPCVAIFANGVGRAKISAFGVRNNKPYKIAELMIEANRGPRPPPVIPPTPIEPPTPIVPPQPVVPPTPVIPPVPDVTPTPPVPPQPVVATGFRVIIVFESSANLGREQLNALYSTEAVKYLNEKCVKDSTGRSEWRRWDKDVQISSKESPTMRSLWESVKPKLGSLPQIAISVDGKFDIFPLPATEAETIALLKKYGG